MARPPSCPSPTALGSLSLQAVGRSTEPVPPGSQLQGACPSRPVPLGRGVLQALAPEPHPWRLPPSRGVRPKELGTGPRLWLPPRIHHRVIMASEGALGRHFPSLSSPEDDRHRPPITGFLAGPAHLAGEQLMFSSIWASPQGQCSRVQGPAQCPGWGGVACASSVSLGRGGPSRVPQPCLGLPAEAGHAWDPLMMGPQG